MKTDELRAKYLEFFQSKDHTVCASDVLVPKWDKSVLFTPAGMNQFKDHFLGKVKLDFTRATSSQKCLRTGDIENVGRTAYHHTFFEMLGNFSFGDYFKREAINWAWEFLTEKKWLGLQKHRLSVTVYLDDDEAADIWHKDIGLSLERIRRLDEKENFWPASAPSKGPDGICGPCSEIFFHPDDGSECEIWNLVFTQFNREGDPPGNLIPLPSKNIDTGMGLERTAATLQGVTTNFHIDTLMPIVQAPAEVCGVKYDPDSGNGRRLRRITDHIRACALAIHENVYPGAQKEESVVRLLLRRAVLQGYEMGLRDPFLYQLVPSVVEQLGTTYPDLRETVDRVASVIKAEEHSFYGVIERGIPRVEEFVREAIKTGNKKLDANRVAEAYQTHGLPATIAESVAEQHGLSFDWAEFEEAMEQHGSASSTGEKTVMGDAGPLEDIKREVKSTGFLGYDSVEAKSEVCGLLNEFDRVPIREQTISTGFDKQIVVLKETPFYAESGGQVGDAGWLQGPTGRFEVVDTQKAGDVVVHWGRITEGTIKVGDLVTATVDDARRNGIRRAHSATHILHYALQRNLGQHAQQRGSKVSDDHLRFDFSNQDPVDDEQLAAIEKMASERISESAPIKAEILPLEDARKRGAMMLFGEKYPDPVRMVSIGDFSKELCGGIHLTNTDQIEAFEIIAEENVSAGTRRIQALTGKAALQRQECIRAGAHHISDQLKVNVRHIPEAIAALSQRIRSLKKELSSGKKSSEGESQVTQVVDAKATDSYSEIRSIMRESARLLNVPLLDVADRVDSMIGEIESLKAQFEKLSAVGDIDADDLIASGEVIGGICVIAKELPGASAGLMMKLIDQVRKKTQPVAVLFATAPSEGKVLLSAGISRDLVEQGWNAGKWLGTVATVVDGRGGGKPDLAQAGGKNPAKIGEALQTAIDFMKTKQTT